jgi:hypothetical protein
MIREADEGETSRAIPERSSLAAASRVISCGSVRTPWRHISNQHMNVLRLIGRAAVVLSLAHQPFASDAIRATVTGRCAL